MLNRIFFFSLILMTPIQALAKNQSESNANALQIIPPVRYESLSLTSQSIQSSSAGINITGKDVQFVGLYTQHEFKEPLLYDFPRRYHTIDALLDGKHERHQYLGIFKSESDQPVSGGINTYEAAAVYGYELVNEHNLSLVFGGGIAVGNFSIGNKRK